MKIIRMLFVVVLFTACVFFATANMHDVALTVPRVPGLPGIGGTGVEAPLFVVVLGALLLGALLMGGATLLEQLRLRAAARKARREAERATKARETAQEELARASDELERTRAQAEQLRAELESVRAELEGVRAECEGLREQIAHSQRAAPAEEEDAAQRPGSLGEDPSQ